MHYTEEKEFNVLRGQVPLFTTGDIQLAFTINGNSSIANFPSKDDGYVVNI